MKNLVKFGNYMVSQARKNRFEMITHELIKSGIDVLPTEERLKSVHDGDLSYSNE